MTPRDGDDLPVDPAFERELRASVARQRRRANGAPDAVASDEPAPERILDAVAGRLPEDERLAVLDRAMRTERGRREVALLRTASVAADEAFPVARPRPWWRQAGVAAAAALLLAVGAGGALWRGRPADGGADALRSAGSDAAGVVLVDPDVRAGAALRWRAVPGAVRYDVEVLGADGAVLHAAATRDTTLALPPTLATPAEGAEWWVRARLTDGTVRRSAPGRLLAR